MKKSAASSRSTASSTDIRSSRTPFEAFDLERDIPATEEDILVQRELRRQPGKNLLPLMDELMKLRQFENVPPRRTTSEGREPFELD